MIYVNSIKMTTLFALFTLKKFCRFKDKISFVAIVAAVAAAVIYCKNLNLLRTVRKTFQLHCHSSIKFSKVFAVREFQGKLWAIL